MNSEITCEDGNLADFRVRTAFGRLQAFHSYSGMGTILTACPGHPNIETALTTEPLGLLWQRGTGSMCRSTQFNDSVFTIIHVHTLHMPQCSTHTWYTCSCSVMCRLFSAYYWCKRSYNTCTCDINSFSVQLCAMVLSLHHSSPCWHGNDTLDRCHAAEIYNDSLEWNYFTLAVYKNLPAYMYNTALHIRHVLYTIGAHTVLCKRVYCTISYGTTHLFEPG